MPTPKRRLWVVLQASFVIAAVWYASVALARQWVAIRELVGQLRPDWMSIFLSAVLVLAAYALLIQTWRAMLASWAARLPYGQAARIWFVSNLGKYIPGKVWQLAALSVMARERGVSAVAATGSSVVVNLASVVSGMVLVLGIGTGAVALPPGSGLRLAIAVVVSLGVAVLVLPVLPDVVARVARVTGRSVNLPRIPRRVVWTAMLGTAAAWLLYGLAFERLARGIVETTGPLVDYVAVYAASYLAGYLTPLAPGGIGVREAVLAEGLVRLGLTGRADAFVLAWGSRVWLTILEIGPAMLFIAADPRGNGLAAADRDRPGTPL